MSRVEVLLMMDKNISGVPNSDGKCKKLIEFSNYACTLLRITSK